MLRKQSVSIDFLKGVLNFRSGFLPAVLVALLPFNVLAQNPGFYPANMGAPNKNSYGQNSYGPQAPAGIIAVGSSKIGKRVVIGGTVVPYQEVTLTAQVPGRVEFIAGREGDWFGANQMVVAISDDQLLARKRQAIAELGGIDSSYRDAKVQYSREFWSPNMRSGGGQNGGLFPSMFARFFGGGGSSPWSNGNPWIERQANLYSQGTNITRARSQYQGAISRIEEMDARLRDTVAIAPFEGVIVQKLIEVGDTVQPGQALLRFADTRYLQIQVEVPMRIAPYLHKGLVVPARLDVGDKHVEARVAQIFPVANSKRHTVTVKFDLPEGVIGGPGMYAEVMLPESKNTNQPLPVVPATAVVWRGSLPAVFVMNYNNQPELRLVRLGEAIDAGNVAVLSGLQVGERIFSTPAPGMRSGWQSKLQQ